MREGRIEHIERQITGLYKNSIKHSYAIAFISITLIINAILTVYLCKPTSNAEGTVVDIEKIENEKEKISNVDVTYKYNYGTPISLDPERYLIISPEVIKKDIEVSTTIENEEGKNYPSIGVYIITFDYSNEKIIVKIIVVKSIYY